MSQKDRRKLEELARTNPDQFRLEIKAALQRLASKGLIFDTGKKRWCEASGRYEIVWAAIKYRTLN
jgi:hypothetical protein